MNFKTLGRKATAKMGRQILSVKTHSPSLLIGVGAVGFTTSLVLACQATLKVSEILEKGEANLKKADAAQDSYEEEEIKKAKFGVRLKTAIEVAKVYAPSALVFGISLAAVTGSHMILKKRNAGLVAAYTVLDHSFRKYRGRVVADQGEQKDFEYFHGVEEREQVRETDKGPVVETVKGLDQESIENEDPEENYRRVFNRKNKHWSDIPNQNQFVIQLVQQEANHLLRLQGHVFLNQVYDMLGFEPTAAGQIVGWGKDREQGEGDGFIDFGVWNDGVFKGMQWLNGDSESLLLDFNVDGPILGRLKKV